MREEFDDPTRGAKSGDGAGTGRPQEQPGDGRPEPDAGDTALSAASTTQRALDEQRDRYLRLAAEFENFRKRTARERQEEAARAQGELVRQLIDPLDDLDRVAAADPATVDARTIAQGIEAVDSKMMKALTAAGLEVIDPLDQPFDHALQEAVATEPALSPEDDHMVGQVFQRGYLFKGQLLRPARVVVKQWTE